MAELTIREPKDIEKLTGWTMDKVTVRGTAIIMRISNPLAACPVRVIMTPVVSMGLAANVVVANGGINVAVNDILPDEVKG